MKALVTGRRPSLTGSGGVPRLSWTLAGGGATPGG